MFEYLSNKEAKMLGLMVKSDSQKKKLDEFLVKHGDMVHAWEEFLEEIVPANEYPKTYYHEGVVYQRKDDSFAKIGDYMISFSYDDYLVMGKPYLIITPVTEGKEYVVKTFMGEIPINNLNAIAYERVSDNEEV